MTDQQRYARIPATVRAASWHKNADVLAEAGQLTGRGTSQAAALADLGSQLAAMASRAQEAPAFWWDAANRVLWVTVPDAVHGGCTAYPVHMDGEVPTTSGGVSSYAAGATVAMAASVGIVPVGPGGYRDRPGAACTHPDCIDPTDAHISHGDH